MADQEQENDDDAQDFAYPEVPPMSEAEMSCKIGDLLKVIAPLEMSGTMEKYAPSVVQPSGQTYKVVGLFGRGWDLELASGDGPKEIRILNRYVKDYFRRVDATG